MSDQAETEVKEVKATKSIVPARYAGRYKAGGSDALAEFINAQCKGKEGFEYEAFFELALKNGVSQEQVDKYRGQVAEKRHGSQGRARMTIRNMIATNVRKTGVAIGLNDEETPIELAKPVLSGAAAKAREGKAGEAVTDSEF
jgi:hypothetical protein